MRTALLLLPGLIGGCSGTDLADDSGPGPGDDTAADTGGPPVSLGDDATVIFLHHSTGGNVWAGGVPEAVAAYDGKAGTSYAITELAYPHDPYPWANYPYDWWHLWVEGGGAAEAELQETLDALTADYDLIVFKHCFPVSSVVAPDGNPLVASPVQTDANYRLQYEAIEAVLLGHPDQRFLVWTGAALVAGATSPEDAQRAHDFFEWVRTTWDEPGDNVFVWDFWELETGGGIYMLDEHAASAEDSHPNEAFSAEAAPCFARRVIDVIEGYGDDRPITGCAGR